MSEIAGVNTALLTLDDVFMVQSQRLDGRKGSINLMFHMFGLERDGLCLVVLCLKVVMW